MLQVVKIINHLFSNFKFRAVVIFYITLAILPSSTNRAICKSVVLMPGTNSK